MARIKQAKPVERQPSTEYITRQDQKSTPSKRRDEMVSQSNGVAEKATATSAKKEAGVTQLVIAVAGIYGSLYVSTPFCDKLRQCAISGRGRCC